MLCVRFVSFSPLATVTEHLGWQKLYGELVLWRRLQHPNIVPVLGVTTETPLSFEIVCGWMENGSITEYMDEHPQVDCIDLVSGFVSSTTTPSRMSNIAAAGRGEWSLLPPLIRDYTW